MVQQLQMSCKNNSQTDSATINIEKYSLRRRQNGRKSITHQHHSIINLSNTATHKLSEKRSKHTKANSSTAYKIKAKAAPLSKYRRKTANARERSRMREINLAFESLRQCVPPTIAEEDVGCTNEKLTKITTLRLAMKYIRKLNEALTDPNFEADFLHENNKDSYFDQEKVNDCVHSKLNTQFNLDPVLDPVKSPSNKRKLQSQGRKKNSFAVLGAHNKRPPDVFQINFDSDGESLHLSEACLTENSDNIYPDHELSYSEEKLNTVISDNKLLDKNPLELSLCIVNEPVGSKELILDQEPIFCSSPFLTLDPFNPFNDFLELELSEHNSIDHFLT